MFLALCFLFASGIFKPEVGNLMHNAYIFSVSVLLLGTSGAFAIAATQPEMLLRKKRKGNKIMSDNAPVSEPLSVNEKDEEIPDMETRGTDILITENGNLKGVIIPRGLNTTLARRVFSRAIDAGFITVNGTHLIWNESTVLLAYMCGRIYCKDKSEKVPYDNKYCWVKGQDGFPNAELTRLFQRESIGQARLNRNSSTVPKKSEEIDIFFERS